MIDKYLETGKYFIASINGEQCKTIESFLDEIGKAFSFPKHYGRNMNALKDCINDLDWINKDNYILIINNFESFIIKNKEDREDVIKFLNRVSEEWRNVPNYEGEDESRKKSDFVIVQN
jgi:RNAse (barnase) inhibitor barstar